MISSYGKKKKKILKFGQWFFDTNSSNYTSLKNNSKETSGFFLEGNEIVIVSIIYEEVKDLLTKAQLKHVVLRNTFSLTQFCS